MVPSGAAGVAGAAASEVTRPATQRSPAPELLKLLVGSMYCGLSEKSLPSAPGRLVRSVHVPPTGGIAVASIPAASNAIGSTAPFGASLARLNSSCASAASWLDCPAGSCEEPVAKPGATLPTTTTAAEATSRASRRISPSPIGDAPWRPHGPPEQQPRPINRNADFQGSFCLVSTS